MQHEGQHEDDELLTQIAAGRQDALTRLIARHSRGLHIFAARFLGNAADAEDVVQDVFMSVWRHAARFDPRKARASTWLYRIAANRCIDQRRRRVWRSFIGLDDMDLDPASDEPDTVSAISARQELAHVRAGMRRLPARQRMALLLRAVADFDVPAVAEVMGVSVGAAEQLLIRARRALRDYMTAADRSSERKAR